jgi:Tfp pilus assembly protein PilN
MSSARHLNLLPRDRRKGLKREVLISAANRFLRSVVFGFGLMTAIAVGISLIIGTITVTVSSLADTELVNQVKLYNDLGSEIDEQNSRLELVNSLEKDRVLWSKALSSLLEIVPPDTSIELLKGQADQGKLIFEGIAPTRTALVIFRERLLALPWVVGVEAPGSNLLARENPRYSFTLLMDKSVLLKMNDDGEKK